jgi:hypothetical protein
VGFGSRRRGRAGRSVLTIVLGDLRAYIAGDSLPAGLEPTSA